jgi:hypothetical protein
VTPIAESEEGEEKKKNWEWAKGLVRKLPEQERKILLEKMGIGARGH